MHLRGMICTISLVFVVSGMSATSDISARSAASQSPDTATLYRVNCQMCHGPGGKAPIPEMAFVGRIWKHGTKSADMAAVITNGVAGTPMMSFKRKFTPDQIKALARHVRAFDKSLPPEK